MNDQVDFSGKSRVSRMMTAEGRHEPTRRATVRPQKQGQAHASERPISNIPLTRGVVMRLSVLERLCCAVCRGPLESRAFQQMGEDEIESGVVWCSACRSWFPVEGGLLELL